MRTIRSFFAVVLMGLALSAFQVDASAQSRGGASRSSNERRQVSPNGPSASVKPSATNKPAVQVRQNAPAREVKSENKPSNTVKQPAAKPDQNYRSSQRPSSSSVQRPSSGSSQRPNSGSAQKTADKKQPQSSAQRPANGSVQKPAGQKPAQSTVQRPAQRPNAGPSQRPSAAPAQRPAPSPAHRPAQKPAHNAKPVQIRPDHRHDMPRVHPVHRDFIAYDRLSCFWSPNRHYFGHRVRVLPARAKLYRHHGISYYCYNDIWYRPYGGYYVVCRPPFGTVLAANILNDIAWTAVTISYYNTVANTYRTISENNEYIAQQNAVIAQNNAMIAAQNQTLAMNKAQADAAYALADDLGLIQSYAAAGSDYFYQDGVFYTKSSNGEYNVIVPPAGALVESLPDDYDMITLKGTEYYKVDDTVYKVTMVDGQLFFEVIGQLAA